MKTAQKLLAIALMCQSLSANGILLKLETDAPDTPVIHCGEWSQIVHSVAKIGLERFLLLLQGQIQRSRLPFIELADRFVIVNQLDGSRVAGTMAFMECRGIP